MTVAEYLSSSMPVDAMLGLAALTIFLFAVLVRKKAQRRMTDIESRLESRYAKHDRKYAGIEGGIASIREECVRKTQALREDIDSVSRRARELFENDDQIRQELEEKLAPIVEALGVMDAKIDSLENTLQSRILKKEEEIKSMMRALGSFSEDNRKIKDFIRERTIDLEL